MRSEMGEAGRKVGWSPRGGVAKLGDEYGRVERARVSCEYERDDQCAAWSERSGEENARAANPRTRRDHWAAGRQDQSARGSDPGPVLADIRAARGNWAVCATD